MENGSSRTVVIRRDRYRVPGGMQRPGALVCEEPPARLVLRHRAVRGDGDLDRRAAIETIVTVQRRHGLGNAGERQLVRHHLLQRQPLTFDDAYGRERVLFGHAQSADEGGVLGDELLGRVERHRAVVARQPYFEETAVTITQVIYPLGPGGGLAHTAPAVAGRSASCGPSHKPWPRCTRHIYGTYNFRLCGGDAVFLQHVERRGKALGQSVSELAGNLIHTVRAQFKDVGTAGLLSRAESDPSPRNIDKVQDALVTQIEGGLRYPFTG